MITYPLNNIDYTAEDAELFHCTRTSGIWAENSFQISATGSDNNVTIGTGIAWIKNEEFSGKVTALKTVKVLDLGIADGVYPRIDVIAIQFNANSNETDVVVKRGTPATNPVRPSIVRTGAIYELYLASIYRPVGATAITASNITDLRMDKTVCGLMADSVTKVDMDAIHAQLMGLVEELEEAIQNIEVGEVVPIEKGGTDATTTKEALANLGAFPKVIAVTTAGTDLNDYDEDGWYFFANSVAPTNIPAGVNGWLLVSSSDGKGSSFVKQVWFRAGTPNTNDFHMFTRTRAYDESSWSDWVTILTNKNGISIKKVWENPKITSSFVPQKISFTKESNDIVLIEYIDYTDTTLKQSVMLQGGSGVLESQRQMTSANEVLYFFQRTFDVNNSGVTFGTCNMKVVTSATKYENQNDGCVPHKIYLIKGVQ